MFGIDAFPSKNTLKKRNISLGVVILLVIVILIMGRVGLSEHQRSVGILIAPFYVVFMGAEAMLSRQRALQRKKAKDETEKSSADE